LSQAKVFEIIGQIIDSRQVFEIKDIDLETTQEREIPKELQITAFSIVAVYSKFHSGVITHEFCDSLQAAIRERLGKLDHSTAGIEWTQLFLCDGRLQITDEWVVFHFLFSQHEVQTPRRRFAVPVGTTR
jgi:hypothetical protein